MKTVSMTIPEYIYQTVTTRKQVAASERKLAKQRKEYKKKNPNSIQMHERIMVGRYYYEVGPSEWYVRVGDAITHNRITTRKEAEAICQTLRSQSKAYNRKA